MNVHSIPRTWILHRISQHEATPDYQSELRKSVTPMICTLPPVSSSDSIGSLCLPGLCARKSTAGAPATKEFLRDYQTGRRSKPFVTAVCTPPQSSGITPPGSIQPHRSPAHLILDYMPKKSSSIEEFSIRAKSILLREDRGEQLHAQWLDKIDAFRSVRWKQCRCRKNDSKGAEFACAEQDGCIASLPPGKRYCRRNKSPCVQACGGTVANPHFSPAS